MVGGLEDGDPHWAGPYQLLGRLGHGGMGQVYFGRSAGGRPVAVKVIRPDLAGDASFRARFRQEVAAARKVNGLFTALVVDADPDGPMPWLATAYIPGPSLAEAVARHGKLPAETVLALAAGLAEGLQAIHATGLVHRDLKPSNVLLADDGPRMIDFGISRAAEASSLTHTGAVMGSPGFMSPEQAMGQEAGPPSDIFSLGAVLTFAATGQGPFGSGSTHALIYRVVHEQPSLDGLPALVRPLVENCLIKDPASRPDAGEVLAQLSTTALAADWLPEQIVRDLPRYAVSEPDPGGATAAGDSPAQRTVTAAGLSPGPGPTTGQPMPGGVTGNRQRGGRRRAALASAAVVLAVSAVVGFAVAARPAAGHPQLGSGSATTSSAALAASRAAAPQQASSAASGPPSAAASPSVRTTTGGSAGGTSGGSGGTTGDSGGGSTGGVTSKTGSVTPNAPAAAVAASVSSAFVPLNGYVFVTYQDGSDSNATVSGQVTNAVSGEVARLYAQQFPFSGSPAQVGSDALDPSGTIASYSFQVTPTLATRYTVEVFSSSTATTPLGTSAVSTVYVVQQKGNNSTRTCTGSQCQVVDTATVLVPASALSTQMAEHVYTYFGISYAASGSASVPATLQLGAGDMVVGSPQQLSADEYQFTLTFSFSTDDENYVYSWHNCTVSVEAQDGVGLPGGGDYGCGDATIPQTEAYLG